MPSVDEIILENEFMRITSVEGRVIARIKVQELDHESSTAIRGLFEQQPELVGGKTVELDLSYVQFAASTAIGQLIHLNKLLKKRGKNLVLSNLTSAMEELAHVTKLDRLIQIKLWILDFFWRTNLALPANPEFLALQVSDGELFAKIKVEELDHMTSLAICTFFEDEDFAEEVINLDLSRVQYAGSLGLGQLIHLHSILNAKKKKLMLINPSKVIERLLRMSKLDKILNLK